MSEALLLHEPFWRGAAFAGVLITMVVLEWSRPRRRVTARAARWVGNASLVIVGTLFLRLAFPVLAVGAALWAQSAGVGLFHWINAPLALAVMAGILLLDLAVYAQHRVMHAVPLLWRLHRVHHGDTHLDASTALRFHPLEIALSMLWKMAVVVALGVPTVAVVLFEIILSSLALFNHANMALPARLDRALRKVLVTPDMHLVHHSAIPSETNSNFGFCLSCWDRWFGSYTEAPREGIQGMTIGLETFRAGREQWPDRLLTNPFRRPG